MLADARRRAQTELSPCSLLFWQSPPRARPAPCCAPSPSGCTSTSPGIIGLCTRTWSWCNSRGMRCPLLPFVLQPCTRSGARLRLLQELCHEQRHLGTPAPPRPPAQGGGCCFLAPGPAGAGWRPGAGGEAEKKGWRRALRGHGAETSLRRHVLVLERAEGPQPAGCLRARAVPALAQRWPSEPRAESSRGCGTKPGCKGIGTPIKPCSTPQGSVGSQDPPPVLPDPTEEASAWIFPISPHPHCWGKEQGWSLCGQHRLRASTLGPAPPGSAQAASARAAKTPEWLRADKCTVVPAGRSGREGNKSK